MIERQLAHMERNQVRAAYHRSTYMQDREKLMQWWADYLDANREKHVTPYDFANRGEGAGNVVPVNFGKAG